MSKDEARNRLAGTFAFTMVEGRVQVHDEELIREIQELTAAFVPYADLGKQPGSNATYSQSSYMQHA